MLDFSRYLPGAYFGWIAADLGADVIQIEHPGQIAKWRAANSALSDEQAQLLRARQSWRRNKRSLMINPGSDAAAAVMHELVRSADVLVEDYRAGVMQSMGLGYEEMSRLNPRLVYCSVSLAGRRGPLSGQPGHDPIALALSGALSRLNNTPRPTLPGLQVADVLAGAHATIGILTALQQRQSSGEGCHVDAAMSDACMPLNMITIGRNPDLDALGPPEGRFHPKGGVWECADGRFLCTTDMEPAFWRRFCDAIGRPEFGPQQHRTDLHEKMEREIAQIMKTRTRDEWADLLGKVDTQAMPVFSLAEAAAHEHNRARGIVFDMEVDGTTTTQVGAPHGLDRQLLGMPCPAALPGEHSAEILAALGFDYDQLRDTGAMGE